MVQAHAYDLLNQKESEPHASMAGASDHPLYAATKRLVNALDHLETRLQQAKPVAGSRQAELFERENAALRQEHEKLNGAISDLKTRYDDLQHTATTIYGKLEDSIKRLTQIIEN